MISNHRGMTFKWQLLLYVVLAADHWDAEGLPESLLVLQFVATLTTNIEKLSGSPVQVTVDSVTAGSVTVATTVVFLSGESSSASAYRSALTSGGTSSRLKRV